MKGENRDNKRNTRREERVKGLQHVNLPVAAATVISCLQLKQSLISSATLRAHPEKKPRIHCICTNLLTHQPRRTQTHSFPSISLLS